MARRLLLTLTTLTLTAAGCVGAGVVGATEARAADAAPTDVSIVWDTTSGAGPRVKVTWQDAAGTANRVRFVDDAPDAVVLVPATDPNVAFLDPSAGDPTRIAVEVGDSAGPTSPAGLSAAFDRALEGPPVLDGLVPHDGTLTLSWHVPTSADQTPGDPLDTFPAGWPHTRVTHFCGGDYDAGTQTSFTPPARDPLFGPWQVTVNNPWGPAASSSASAVDTTLTSQVPATTTYGSPVAITGVTLSEARDTRCVPIEVDGPVRTIQLQARNAADAPWYAVTSLSSGDRRWQLSPTAIGARQFRVVAGAASWPERSFASEPVVSAPTTAQTTAWVRSARFLTPTVRRGERSTAHVWVSPGLRTTALLQRRTSTGWVSVKQMPMVNGVADYRFTPTATGSWRWVTPTTHGPNGLTIAWTATPPFTVTVR